jgi:3-oxoadipate enol-lactonase
MERFGRDVLAILDDLNIEMVHWCGLSMGGMVGQWLGANAPERMGKIILSNTACYYPDPTNWLNRIKAVKEAASQPSPIPSSPAGSPLISGNANRRSRPT